MYTIKLHIHYESVFYIEKNVIFHKMKVLHFLATTIISGTSQRHAKFKHDFFFINGAL